MTDKSWPKPKYPVPSDVVSIFPYKCHPLDGVEPMYSAAQKWSFECSLFTPTQHKRIATSGAFASYFYPDCPDPRRYYNLYRQMIMFFIIDDHCETTEGDVGLKAAEADNIIGQLHEVCDKLLGDRFVSARDWKPYMLSAYALYEDILVDYNDVQKRRYVHLWREWTDSMIDQCRNITDAKQYKSADEFYKIRENGVAAKCTMHMIEYAYELYVPEPEWQNPRFQLYLTLGARATVYTNDLYSIDKELMDAGGRVERVFNGIAILSRVEGIPLDAALQRVAAMMRKAEESMVELANEIAGAEWASAHTPINNVVYRIALSAVFV
ncbi:unnamed protein product [Medioppia subpectinata]|uniref:Terpene synthase n=1 Tax=Medioppia subpectinata TaxID=1979941 RepID=A0A7R9L816_9ACAR|nr:unnamed protein product [Medioppia subpectinata]CAG2116758.1 unnamed protein product [Medioppia subpectinata]